MRQKEERKGFQPQERIDQSRTNTPHVLHSRIANVVSRPKLLPLHFLLPSPQFSSICFRRSRANHSEILAG